MTHTIESAPSGRAKCRGCGKTIAKGEPRVGENLPNPFAERGTMTLWFHPRCGALKRPEVWLEAVPAEGVEVPDRESLDELARKGLEHRRLPRIDGGQQAPTGRARCRSCRTLIDTGLWRIKLVYYAEGRFEPAGFIHASCARDYLGTVDVVHRAAHFAELDADAVDSLQTALRANE
jgi:hypothetical protein